MDWLNILKSKMFKYMIMMVQLVIKVIHTKTAKLYKKERPSKSLGGKSCEIEGGGHEMAAMMWMILNFNDSLCAFSPPKEGSSSLSIISLL